MAYVSTKCLARDHEECVTGASVFNIEEPELCTCPCHEATAAELARLHAQGFTKQELKRMWYLAREPERQG